MKVKRRLKGKKKVKKGLKFLHAFFELVVLKLTIHQSATQTAKPKAIQKFWAGNKIFIPKNEA